MTDRLADVYEAFYDKIELDSEYFQYFDVDEIEAMKIAQERARSYLREACSYLRRHVTLDFSLRIEKDETGEEHFAASITDDEVDLLAAIMLVPYYERGLAKLRPKLNTFSASELKLLHSPANERQTYLALIENQRANINFLIADYYAKDRLTGAEKMISTTIPEDSE